MKAIMVLKAFCVPIAATQGAKEAAAPVHDLMVSAYVKHVLVVPAQDCVKKKVLTTLENERARA
jgi:hypothetical protein